MEPVLGSVIFRVKTLRRVKAWLLLTVKGLVSDVFAFDRP
jgi:hypothetical protein